MSRNIMYKKVMPSEAESHRIHVEAKPDKERVVALNEEFLLPENGGDDYAVKIIEGVGQLIVSSRNRSSFSSGSVVAEGVANRRSSSDRYSYFDRETHAMHGEGYRVILYLGCRGKRGIEPRVRNLFVKKEVGND